jgi:hypothetical protein
MTMIALAAVLTTPATLVEYGAVPQSTTPTVTIDGARLQTPGMPQPFIEDGRVQVPMRAVFEALGASVQYLPSLRQVVATHNGRQTTLFLDENFAYIDGDARYLDYPPRIIGGHVMVPLHFVSESLGAWVHWDRSERNAIVRMDMEAPDRIDSKPEPHGDLNP